MMTENLPAEKPDVGIRVRKPDRDQVAWFCGAAGVAVLAAASQLLWPHWEFNPQYQYGVFMPFLCVMLVYLRWEDRPVPLAPRTKGGYLLAAFLAVVSVMVLAVIQPVGMANPDWRKVASLGALMVVVWGWRRRMRWAACRGFGILRFRFYSFWLRFLGLAAWRTSLPTR